MRTKRCMPGMTVLRRFCINGSNQCSSHHHPRTQTQHLHHTGSAWQSTATPSQLADRKSNRTSTMIECFWVLKNLPIGICVGAYTGPVDRDFSLRRILGGDRCSLPRSVGQTTVTTPLPTDPTDALIDLKVRHRLGRFIPIWLNVGPLDTIAHLRTSTRPTEAARVLVRCAAALNPPRCGPVCGGCPLSTSLEPGLTWPSRLGARWASR
jgi:hypothetical protein